MNYILKNVQIIGFLLLCFICTYNESVLIQNQELTCIGQMVWEQREDQADHSLDARSDFSTGFYLPTLPTVLTALPCLPHRLLPISQPPTHPPTHPLNHLFITLYSSYISSGRNSSVLKKKNLFFGRFLPNVGGWGGWLPKQGPNH